MNLELLCSIRDHEHVLSVHREEIILVTGPIGSGKTRFLRRLAGLLPLPSAINMKWKEAATIRMLFDHNPPLWLAPTLEEELLFGLHPTPKDTEVYQVRTEWKLDTLPLDSQVESLDRLQSLRLRLAAIELANTGLALLDNPTASLPVEDAESIRNDISAWALRSGCAVVIACNRWHDWKSWVQQIWSFTLDTDLPKMENKFD